jgi:hypothetical protein
LDNSKRNDPTILEKDVRALFGVEIMLFTTTTIPPQIHQYFTEKMLSLPTPKMRDDSATLRRVYFWIKTKLMKKCVKYPEWKKECEQLEKQFVELYERTLAKEKELETEKGHKTQEPFYWITVANRSNQAIFRGLQRNSNQISLELWRNNEVSAVF